MQLFAHMHRKPVDEIRRTIYGDDEPTKAVLEWADAGGNRTGHDVSRRMGG